MTRNARNAHTHNACGPQGKGSLLVIGGHESRANGADILGRFVELSGGPDAAIMVITAASEEPDVLWRDYKTALDRIGARHCQGLHVKHRREAGYGAPVDAVGSAGGIFIAGGDQRRLMDCLHRTPLADALAQALRRGACVAGTSAGASALAQHMLEQGETDLQPRKGAVRLGEGLCLLPRVVIDQHFSERRRLARLLSAVAENPSLYGIGIDENTALLVRAAEGLEVIGAGGVTVVDGSGMHTDADGAGDGSPLEMIGARLHILPSGAHYRLDDTTPGPIARLLRAMKAEELSHEERQRTQPG